MKIAPELRSRLPCADPKSGPLRRNGEKMAEKWIVAPPGKRGKSGRKMGKLVQNGAKNGSKMAIFPFFGHFSLFSRWGQNLFFGHFFPFRAGGPIWGQDRAIRIATLQVLGNKAQTNCQIVPVLPMYDLPLGFLRTASLKGSSGPPPPNSVAPYRAILRYYRCGTPYHAILLREISMSLPKFRTGTSVRYPMLQHIAQ